ncbi:unnamed protein product [Linum trigynum]|uniref:Uncharacterized protein n=1 Tax=Linum trigynum TaxID=586398 RepID=A0AAV2F4T1_9ROSI
MASNTVNPKNKIAWRWRRKRNGCSKLKRQRKLRERDQIRSRGEDPTGATHLYGENRFPVATTGEDPTLHAPTAHRVTQTHRGGQRVRAENGFTKR